jgi:hypothetical protein
MRLIATAALVLTACGGGIVGAAQGSLVVDMSPINFGANPVLTPNSKTLEVQNVGRAPIHFKAPIALANIQPAGSNAFTLQTGLSPSEAFTGTSHNTIVLTFSAAAEGSYSANLIISSDDKAHPNISIPITGQATTVAQAAATPSCLDFGNVCQGHTAIQSVSIASKGTAPLLINSLALAGGTSPAFGPVGSWNTNPPVSVPAAAAGMPDQSVDVSVAFQPTPATVDSNQMATGTLQIGTNDPTQETISVCLKGTMEQTPVAMAATVNAFGMDAGQTIMVAPGTMVGLDGSASTNPSGDGTLTYQWSAVSCPQGSACDLTNSTSAMASILADTAGQYVVSLVVSNGTCTSSAPATVTIIGVLSNDMEIDLTTTDNPTVDLDLHLRPDGQALYGPEDCWWNTPDQSWNGGTCHQYGDVLEGYGPEKAVVQAPAAGNYRVTVVYANANGASNTDVTAVVEVKLYGMSFGQVSKKLTMPGTFPSDMGETWDAALVTWPSGAISANPASTQ